MYGSSPLRCVALCTRVTLGLDMCKICTEAVHCVSSPLSSLLKMKPPSSNSLPPSSHLQAPSKPSSPSEGFKPPSSLLKPPSSPLQPLEAFWRWSSLEAPFKPLQASRSPLHLWKASSPFQAPLKPPWSSLQAPLKPPWSLLEAPFKSPSSLLQAPLPKVKPPSSLKSTFEECFAEVEAPFVTEECPSWRSPEPSCTCFTSFNFLVALPGWCLAFVWVLVFWVVFVFVWLCGCCFCLGFASKEIFWKQSLPFPVEYRRGMDEDVREEGQGEEVLFRTTLQFPQVEGGPLLLIAGNKLLKTEETLVHTRPGRWSCVRQEFHL